MDVFSPEKRSSVMSRIKNKDTKAETLVRKWLFTKGYRYRKNVTTLPGKPDIVLPRYRTIVFVHGCFWHAHANCKEAGIPKTRTEWWSEKLASNVARDEVNINKLRDMGWKVYVVWECEVEKNFEATMVELDGKIRTSSGDTGDK